MTFATAVIITPTTTGHSIGVFASSGLSVQSHQCTDVACNGLRLLAQFKRCPSDNRRKRWKKGVPGNTIEAKKLPDQPRMVDFFL